MVELQVPELVLQDDRHLLRILRAQPGGDHDSRIRRAKRDIEMMTARQTMYRHVLDRLDHDVAQGVGDPAFIGQQTLDLLLGIIFHS